MGHNMRQENSFEQFSDMTLVNKFQAYTRAEFNIWLGVVMTEDYIFCSIWSDQWQTRDEFLIQFYFC